MVDSREGQMEQRPAAREGPLEPSSEALTIGTGLLLFVLGFAIGFPLATIGWTFVAQHAGFLAALLFVLVVLLLIISGFVVLYRRWIWNRLFQTAEVRMQAFADPLANIARHTASNQVVEAIDAAQELARVALARWAWVSTRRWLIGSITGLIAAMAALAGAALLFRQNELIGEQIVRLDAQNALVTMEIELADAQRATALIPELSAIASGIEIALAQSETAGGQLIMDTQGLPAGLQTRIVAASIVARPYRFIERAGEPPQREAERLRPDLPRVAAFLARQPAPATEARLTEKPISPERGMLLLLLQQSNIVATGSLHLKGADFSYALMTDIALAMPDYRHANLARADFSRSYVREARLGGAILERARFRDANIGRTTFDTLPGADAAPPYPQREQPYTTRLSGADFTGSVLYESSFGGANALFARFDGAVVHKAVFRGASLDGATFRNTVILGADFAGASFGSTDFDGAYVIGADWLRNLGAAAANDSLDPDQFRLRPVAEAEVRAIELVSSHLGVEIPDEAVAGKAFFRVERIKEFD